MILRPKRGLWLPGGTPRIDWSNPISRGLVGCYVALGEGGTVPTIRDLVTQTQLLPFGSPSIVSGHAGMIAKDAASGGWFASAPASQQPTAAISMVWFGQLMGANPVALGAPLLAVATSSGSVPAGLLTDNSPSTTLIWLLNFSGNTVASVFPSTYSGQMSIVATWTSAGPYEVWANGFLKGSGTGSTSALNYGTEFVSVGTFAAGNQALNPKAGMSLGMIFNRALMPSEAQLLSADPTNFLTFPGDLFRSNLVGAAAALAAMNPWTPWPQLGPVQAM